MMKLFKFQHSSIQNESAIFVWQVKDFESFSFSTVEFPEDNNILYILVYNCVAIRQKIIIHWARRLVSSNAQMNYSNFILHTMVSTITKYRKVKTLFLSTNFLLRSVPFFWHAKGVKWDVRLGTLKHNFLFTLHICKNNFSFYWKILLRRSIVRLH